MNNTNTNNNTGTTNNTPRVPTQGAPIAGQGVRNPTAFELRFGNPDSINNPPRPVLGTPRTGYYSNIANSHQRFSMLVNHFINVGPQETPTSKDEEPGWGWKMDAEALSKMKSP